MSIEDDKSEGLDPFITVADLAYMADLYESVGRSREEAHKYAAIYIRRGKTGCAEVDEQMMSDFRNHVRALEEMKRAREAMSGSLKMETGVEHVEAEPVNAATESFIIQCATSIAANDVEIARDMYIALNADDRELLKMALEKTRDFSVKKAAELGFDISDEKEITVAVAKSLILMRFVSVQVGKIFTFYMTSCDNEVMKETDLWKMGLKAGMTKSDVTKAAKSELGKYCSDQDVYRWMMAKLSSIAGQSIDSVGGLLEVVLD